MPFAPGSSLSSSTVCRSEQQANSYFVPGKSALRDGGQPASSALPYCTSWLCGIQFYLYHTYFDLVAEPSFPRFQHMSPTSSSTRQLFSMVSWRRTILTPATTTISTTSYQNNMTLIFTTRQDHGFLATMFIRCYTHLCSRGKLDTMIFHLIFTKTPTLTFVDDECKPPKPQQGLLEQHQSSTSAR